MIKKDELAEEAIDDIVTAQAQGDDAAWEQPMHVKRAKRAAVSLSSELAARAAFFARLHRATNLEDWVQQIIQERLDLEEAAFAQLKRELIAK